MGCNSFSTEIKNSQPEKKNKQTFENNQNKQKELETSPEPKAKNKQQAEINQKEAPKNEKIHEKIFIPRADLYTNEELDFIQKMYEESQGKEDKNLILFYKQTIKLQKKITNITEIFTVKKRKPTNNNYNVHFYFKSPSLRVSDVNVISRYIYAKNEKFSMCSDLIKKKHIWHDFLIFLSDSNEDQLLTFEIITEYTTPINKMLTFIPFDLGNEKDENIDYDITNCKKISIHIEYQVCFSFLGMNNDIYLKNLIKNWVGPRMSIDFEGNALEYYVFNFSYVNYNILLDSKDPSLYCYDYNEKNNLNEAIHNIKFNSEKLNIIGIKDIYSIKNKIINVKSFITFIKFRDHVSINIHYEDTLFYYVEKTDNLKITKVICNNKINTSGTKGGHYLNLIYNLIPKQLFCTVELEYSYSLKCSDKCDTTSIAHDYMGENFYYSLIVNYDPKEYTGFSFMRNQTSYEINEDKSEIKIDTFYKSVKDHSPYETLYLLKF